MKLVTRSAWGARPPVRVTKLPTAQLDTIVFHYTAADADEQADHNNCARRVKGVQNFHMDARGWNDIAYNYLVCKHGYVFEGRGFGVYSAATGKDNNHTIAVCFLGDDTRNRDDVTMAGRVALQDAANMIVIRANKTLRFKGHRDFSATTCPGDEIYAFIKALTSRPVSPENPHNFFTWARWYRGHDEFKPYGPRNPLVRPNVPARIPSAWWGRFLRMLGRRG